MIKKKPKKQQFARQCILCTSTGVTKQHVFPNWIKNIFPRQQNSFDTFKMKVRLDGRLAHIHPVTSKRNGSAGSLKLPILCTNCNNVWASGIEDAARLAVIPWMTGEGTVLNEDAQISIVQWLTLFSIVAEYDDTDTKAVSEQQRHDFKQTGMPSAKWRIWIGTRASGAQNKLAMNHQGFPLVKSLLDPQPECPNFQMTYVAIGDMVAFITSSTTEAGVAEFNVGSMTSKLQPLWPLPSKPIDLLPTPAMVLTEPELAKLNDIFSQTLPLYEEELKKLEASKAKA